VSDSVLDRSRAGSPIVKPIADLGRAHARYRELARHKEGISDDERQRGDDLGCGQVPAEAE